MRLPQWSVFFRRLPGSASRNGYILLQRDGTTEIPDEGRSNIAGVDLAPGTVVDAKNSNRLARFIDFEDDPVRVKNMVPQLDGKVLNFWDESAAARHGLKGKDRRKQKEAPGTSVQQSPAPC
ncbi:MAG TPA: hypothetical protein VNW97_03110 [Candidatus Saccharimonadales bacterium]|jgi:hypothetical protein|nr:hypothetical protein [Candidatus Saccharimonadales bacterium]